METISLVLLMLLLVVVSGFLVRLLRLPLPLPLVQIALGAAIAQVTTFQVTLEPDIFFLLFLPPLLFIDGWRIPKTGLLRDIDTILELALGLVVATVLGMGYAIHWLIPAMPLTVAFALAAVLSPTDPIAVSAIGARTPIPKRMMHILEGESLLNDASGLVCLRFAVAAALTGTFSLPVAFGTFLWLAAGGVAIGVGVTFGIGYAKGWLSKRLGEEPSSQILISLLIPFGAYLLAERLHCSGILAAVAAGISMGYVEAGGQALAVTRIRRNVVWDTVQFAANGVIFVLLGQQLPDLVSGAEETIGQADHYASSWLLLYIGVIMLGLVVLRFAWVWVSVRFTLYRARRRGEQRQPLHWRLVAAMSVAGVRGAITLAGILTLPVLMSDGSPFPARDLAVTIAAGVIIISLLLATIALPRLLAGLDIGEPSRRKEEDDARSAAAEAALRAIEKAQGVMAEGSGQPDIVANAMTRVMHVYRQRLDDNRKTGPERQATDRVDHYIREFRLVALRAERDEIFERARGQLLDDEIMRKLVREIDLLEARYSQPDKEE